MEFSDGYALTTEQITCNEQYWAHMLERHTFDDELLNLTIQQQAMQRSGWLVCENCSVIFEFDRVQARGDAGRQMNPAGCGPVDVQQAAAAAARAWRHKYGRLPNWVKS
jgi:hypothetical protein